LVDWKVRRLLSCVGTSSDGSPASSADEAPAGRAAGGCVCGRDGAACGRCGRCTCADGDGDAAAGSARLRRARSAVDAATCMCCVRCVFYHGLRRDADDPGDDDEPCACRSRPACAARWAVIGALLPVLPCLCLYPPLRCAVDAACRATTPPAAGGGARSCRCGSAAPRRARHPGLKGLLESESSST